MFLCRIRGSGHEDMMNLLILLYFILLIASFIFPVMLTVLIMFMIINKLYIILSGEILFNLRSQNLASDTKWKAMFYECECNTVKF